MFRVDQNSTIGTLRAIDRAILKDLDTLHIIKQLLACLVQNTRLRMTTKQT